MSTHTHAHTRTTHYDIVTASTTQTITHSCIHPFICMHTHNTQHKTHNHSQHKKDTFMHTTQACTQHTQTHSTHPYTPMRTHTHTPRKHSPQCPAPESHGQRCRSPEQPREPGSRTARCCVPGPLVWRRRWGWRTLGWTAHPCGPLHSSVPKWPAMFTHKHMNTHTRIISCHAPAWLDNKVTTAPRKTHWAQGHLLTHNQAKPASPSTLTRAGVPSQLQMHAQAH